MARPLRREFPNAIYHVINRGNYRSDIFGTPGAAAAFVTALREATERFHWDLGAYVIMRNHFHLALRTPEPNLSVGMQWLQVTFASRFNRLREEQGRLFQGRYRAIHLEDEDIWSRVADYIHLNPVRAGIISLDQLTQFRWSSLNLFINGPRFDGLLAAPWLATLGIKDNPRGWTEYGAHLRQQVSHQTTNDEDEAENLSRGWAIGSDEWKQTLLPSDSEQSGDQVSGEHLPPQEVREQQWLKALNAKLDASDHAPDDLRASRKNAPWKLAIANELQRKTGASVTWLARTMQLGSPATARGYLHRYRKNQQNTT